MLRDLGMAVIEAASAEAALTTLQARPVDVLVSDVNLPGLSGPELAEAVRMRRPGIGVVFATGDSEVALVPWDPEAILLPKPYGVEALRSAVLRAATKTAIGRPAAANTADDEPVLMQIASDGQTRG